MELSSTSQIRILAGDLKAAVTGLIVRASRPDRGCSDSPVRWCAASGPVGPLATRSGLVRRHARPPRFRAPGIAGQGRAVSTVLHGAVAQQVLHSTRHVLRARCHSARTAPAQRPHSARTGPLPRPCSSLVFVTLRLARPCRLSPVLPPAHLRARPRIPGLLSTCAISLHRTGSLAVSPSCRVSLLLLKSVPALSFLLVSLLHRPSFLPVTTALAHLYFGSTSVAGRLALAVASRQLHIGGLLVSSNQLLRRCGRFLVLCSCASLYRDPHSFYSPLFPIAGT
jgi:hypothetical protein